MSSGAGASASGAASTSSEAMAPCKNASRLNSFYRNIEGTRGGRSMGASMFGERFQRTPAMMFTPRSFDHLLDCVGCLPVTLSQYHRARFPSPKRQTSHAAPNAKAGPSVLGMRCSRACCSRSRSPQERREHTP